MVQHADTSRMSTFQHDDDQPNSSRATGGARARRSAVNFAAMVNGPNYHSPFGRTYFNQPWALSQTPNFRASSTRFASSSPSRKQFPSRSSQISATIRRLIPHEGRIASRHERRDGMRWTRQLGRERCCQGGLTVSEQPALGRLTFVAYAKPLWSDTGAGAKLSVATIDPTGSTSHQAGSDGGQTNSSPGRARHKP